MTAFRSRFLLLAAALLAALTIAAFAERGDDTDRKSKNGKTEGAIDGVQVVLEFGRPNVKGREIWGGLVPYGKVWRTGSDEATTVSFGADANVNGEKLAAGTYSLFTVPGEAEWSFVFNTVAEQWGAYDYSSGKDALRVTAEPETAEHVESMNFEIKGSSVTLRWEKLAVSVEVAAASE